MNRSESIVKLAAAMLQAQQSITYAVKSGKNPRFNSAYADLSDVIGAIKEPLNAAGLAFMQAVGVVDGNPVVETMLVHTSGEWISTIAPVYCARPNDPQAFGSGVTYTKRYSLQSIVGLPTEDDDANNAMPNSKTEPKAQAKPATPPPAKAAPPATKPAPSAKAQPKTRFAQVVENAVKAQHNGWVISPEDIEVIRKQVFEAGYRTMDAACDIAVKSRYSLIKDADDIVKGVMIVLDQTADAQEAETTAALG